MSAFEFIEDEAALSSASIGGSIRNKLIQFSTMIRSFQLINNAITLLKQLNTLLAKQGSFKSLKKTELLKAWRV